MQKADQLIRTKLHLPLTRPGVISRPRLEEQLQRGMHGPLTMVTAPAGFGKTTLVASCAASAGMTTAWLSLDKNDNQPGRFLRYLVGALQTADQTIGSEAAQMLAAEQQALPDVVLTSLINDLDSSAVEIVLVFDDYQLITNQVVHEHTAFLLEHAPHSFHLVIATRSDPPLPLARLRARGQTVELRADDLRFSEAEAIQFLNDVMNLHLETSAIEVLEERTEGWIAGLQMASIALQSHLSRRGREEVDRFIQEFAGTHRFIMDFMLEEVLARETEEVQAFLLRTSILTQMTGPLCDAVTGGKGGQEMLEQLDRRNLFVVPLDGGRRWYRYHHLFSDLLQAKLYQSGEDQARQLLSRAAAWCEQDGQISEAVSYALAGQDHACAAGLVERYWQPMANNGEIETVWSWLNALPEEMVKKSATLSMACCMILWLTGQVGSIEAHLEDAERALTNLKGTAGPEPELPVVLVAMRSFVARYHEDYETAGTLAEQALSLIPEDLPPLFKAQLRSLSALALASAYDGAGDLKKAADAYAETIRGSRIGANPAGVTGITFRLVGVLRTLGRLRAAYSACRDALDYTQSQGMDRLPAAGILHIALSEVLLEQNDLAGAEAQLAQGMVLGKWSGRMDAVKNSAYVLSRLRHAQRDEEGALAAVQESQAALVDPISPLATAELLALKARVFVRQGALNNAVQCVEQAIRLAGQDRGQTRANVILADCRVKVSQLNHKEAIAHLSETLAMAESCGWMGAAIELHILRGLALFQQVNQKDGAVLREAEIDLERALSLAQPEGYLRIFLDEGQPLQSLLGHWLAHASAGPLRDYAARLLSQFDAGRLSSEKQPQPASPVKAPPGKSPYGSIGQSYAEPEVQPLVEPLSPRELEVLRLMALGRTNPEIAGLLIVAPGTIKAHAASIYRKLDAANRTEAVARARQLGILP